RPGSRTRGCDRPRARRRRAAPDRGRARAARRAEDSPLRRLQRAPRTRIQYGARGCIWRARTACRSSATRSLLGEWTSTVPLHSKNAESRLLDRRVEGRRNRKRQDAARFLRRDHSDVPKARRGIVGMSLPLVLVEDGALEVLFLLLAPRAALRLAPLASRRGETGVGLLPSHHREPGVRPHPDYT